MSEYKVLNLYAGIGGNRKLWNDVSVTAVEINPDIASIYQDQFKEDTVIVDDAHDYLLKHFKEFDFIWSSPECQTHSKLRKNIACSVEVNSRKGGWADPVYPDLTLYQEIIFLQHYFKGKWCVENVVAYYEPLIKPKLIQRHWIWSNFPINSKKFEHDKVTYGAYSDLVKKFGFDLSKYKVTRSRNGARRNGLEKDQIIRNCVAPELGLYILQSAFKERQETLSGFGVV